MSALGHSLPIRLVSASRDVRSSPKADIRFQRNTWMMTRVFDGKTKGLTRDDILDNITFYWLTNTEVSSARLYWENKLGFFAPKNVQIPPAIKTLPDIVGIAGDTLV
jgi:hypothetical protein